MKLSVPSGTLYALTGLGHSVVTESHLSQSAKTLIRAHLQRLENLTTQPEESRLHRAYYHEKRDEVRIELDERKVTELIGMFTRYRAIFVTLFNTLVFVLQSYQAVCRMLGGMPERFHEHAKLMTEDFDEILEQPSCWESRQTPRPLDLRRHEQSPKIDEFFRQHHHLDKGSSVSLPPDLRHECEGGHLTEVQRGGTRII